MSEYAFSEHCTSIAQLESVRKSENASYINSTFSQQKENKRLSHNE